MKRLLFIMLLIAALPAMSQYIGFYQQTGKVVDLETGKPLQGAIVKNHRGSVQTDSEGRYTIEYHTYDSDLRIYVSHQGYITDTFGNAQELVRLRPLPKNSAQLQSNDKYNKNPHAAPKERPTVAVVLSGGGAKGVAHISALRAIEEAGIPIDIICGTSMGSLIGALYSIGYSTDELDSLVRNQDWTMLLSDRTDPATLSLRQREEQNTYALIRGMSSDTPEKGGLIRGRNLNVLFRRLCAGYLDSISFDSLPIRFACVATDIVTNGEVVFHDGYLVQAMRASMAIPAVFTPVRIGEMVLIDGGLRNNYPADVARQMGADIIIGVTVQNDSLRADEITDAMSVFNQIIDINSKNKYDENVALSDIFMKVDVHGYSAASFTHSAIDTLIRRGAEEAVRHRDDLQALRTRIDGLGNGSSKSSDHSDRYRHRQRREPVFDIDSSNTVPPQMNGKSEPSKLNPIVSVGFRFDTEEMGALQLNGKLPFWQQFPMEIGATIRLGKRIMAKVEYGLSTNRVFSPSLSYTFRNNDFNIYSYGIRTYSFKYFQHQAEFIPINFHLRRWEIKAGVRWERFDYYGGVLSIGNDSLELTDKNFFSYRFAADLNTEDHWYFPSRGTRLHVGYAYITDNLVGMDGTIGLTDAALQWRANLPVSRRFSLQSSFFTRLLLGGDVPLIYRNAMGGEWFGHTMEQQVPFAGIGHQEFMERYLIGVQLQAQVRIMRSQYIMLRLAFARNSDELGQLFWPVDNSVDGVPPAWHTPMFGAQIGYSYSTIFGPIDARLGYSTHTRAPYFFLNIGHRF